MLLTLRAAVTLPLIAAAVRARGFRDVAPRRLRAAGDVRLDAAEARAIARAVHRAGRIMRPSCLTRALTIGHLLSRAGLEARVTLGVASDPFAAHAWVEHGGLMLAGEGAGRDYLPICTIEAGRAPQLAPA